MKALRFELSIPRYGLALAASKLGRGAGTAARVGPLSLVDDEAPPPLPGPEWVRVRPLLAGICGSDLATVEGTSSRYFEPIVSFPFTPGHEVVGALESGQRVVLEPVLGCVARGIRPACTACASGQLGRCERITFGHVNAGLQTGFCCDTGGGWSTAMVAHPSQLHVVADELTDEDAVMIEPAACAIHGALAGGSFDGAAVAVIGAGTLGLLVVAALTRWNRPASLVVAAKHPHQRAMATQLGATVGCDPSALRRTVRSVTGSLAIGDGDVSRLTGGADAVIDCVGSPESLTDAMAVVRPGGTIVLVGMPGVVKFDLTPLWHREIRLVGAYAYGIEPALAGRRTFALAMELVAALRLGSMVSALYPLDRYQDALAHAGAAGRRGAVKIAFDLRQERIR